MQYNDAFFKKNMHLIVKIQSLWRGYSGRKLVNFIKQTKRVSVVIKLLSEVWIGRQ